MAEHGSRAAIAAAIDIGTNSVKITVGRRDDAGGVTILLDQVAITRLGKGVDKSGRLDDEAMHRTLTALASFGQDARNLGATTITAVGTSALRDAENGPEFVRAAMCDLGGGVEVIAGEREASLIYAAARHDVDLQLPTSATLMTTDIGGGSTEIVIGRGDEIRFRDSLQLGAVRVTERALHGDTPTADERAAAQKMIDEALAQVPTPVAGESIIVVASGGTAANLAAMEILASQPDAAITPDMLHGTRLKLAQIEARIDVLGSRSLEERKRIPGLEPGRADVILAGAIVQARILRHVGAEEAVVSARGLRFGLLYELLGMSTSEL